MIPACAANRKDTTMVLADTNMLLDRYTETLIKEWIVFAHHWDNCIGLDFWTYRNIAEHQIISYEISSSECAIIWIVSVSCMDNGVLVRQAIDVDVSSQLKQGLHSMAWGNPSAMKAVVWDQGYHTTLAGNLESISIHCIEIPFESFQHCWLSL